MKKIIALVSLILCMSLAFSSCSLFTQKMSFEKIYKDYEYEAPKSISAATSIPALDGCTYVTPSLSLDVTINYLGGDYLLTFTDREGDYKIYNAKTDSVVLTLDSENTSVSCFNVFGVPFIKATKTKTDDNYVTTTTVSIYNAGGMLVAEAKTSDSYSIPTVTKAVDFFKFDGAVYKVSEDGTATAVSNPFAYLPSLDGFKTENYYYDNNSSTVSVYDQDLNCVFYWEVPFDEYDDSEIFLLSDGVLLAQIWEVLPEDAEKYDFISDGEKINLIHYILNAEKDKVKEVDLDFMVNGVYYLDAVYSYAYDSDEESILPEKMINYSSIYYIDDHKIDSDETEVTIKENGDVIELAPEFDNAPMTLMTENRWLLINDNEEKYLLDEEGEIVGNITGYEGYNQKFISTGTKLVDYDLEVVYDAKANGKKIVTMFETSVLLCDETPDSEGKTNYYLYQDGGIITKIENYYDRGSSFYVTYDDSNLIFTFYSETGAVLTTTKGLSYSSIYFDYFDNYAIVKVTDTDGNHYYKFS
jgi:hypothetical protein